jgi:hypothetical protein
MAMTTPWVLDNLGETTLERIADQITSAGGKIVGELRKLDNGGAVANLESKTAVAAMSNVIDWFAFMKIRCHLPKTLLRGTVSIVVKNLSTDHKAKDIVDAMQEEGVEILELYLFKNSRNQLTGTVKATVKGSPKVKEWLEKGKGEIRGARVWVERQRTPMTCFNCNKIGHRAADCKESKKCKKCGQADHLKAECKANAEELKAKCQYCFEEGHNRGGCQKKTADEREERKKFKMEKKDPVLENPWFSNKANNNEKKGNLDDLKAEKDNLDLKALKKVLQDEMQDEMKKMKEEMERFRKDLMQQLVAEMIEQMKKMTKELMEEMMQQQKQWQKQQLSTLLSAKRKEMTTPTRAGDKKKMVQQGEGKNLEKEMLEENLENDNEGDKESKASAKKGKGGGAKKK